MIHSMTHILLYCIHSHLYPHSFLSSCVYTPSRLYPLPFILYSLIIYTHSHIFSHPHQLFSHHTFPHHIFPYSYIPTSYIHSLIIYNHNYIYPHYNILIIINTHILIITSNLLGCEHRHT